MTGVQTCALPICLLADGAHDELLATTPGYARLVRAYERAEATRRHEEAP